MLKKLKHIAIVVPDVKKAKEIYQQKFNAVVSDPKNYPEHGVTVVFVELENTKIELMEPFGKDSPIKKFLEKNPDGGIHHICLEVSDINQSLKDLNNKEVTILGTGKPTKGSHNKPILFLHPKEFCGTLIELEEE
jgi:methylmalonyl-CoA/ethylmalonyl-CoA epimerase